MQKKNLLPLLLTIPAFPALANVDLSTATLADKWQANGISNDFAQDESGRVTATLSNGVLTQTVKLPYGNYKLVVNTPNNCNIVVSGENVTVVKKETVEENGETVEKLTVIESGVVDENCEIVVAGTSLENDVTISVSSEDGINTFGFGNCTITLVEEYYTFATEKETTLTTDVPVAVQENVDKDTKKALADQLKALNDQKDAITAILDGLKKGFPENPTEAITVDALTTLYKEYIVNNGLDEKIEAYDEALKAYNEAVTAANTTATFIANNTQAKEDLLADMGKDGDITVALDAFKKKAQVALPADSVDCAYATNNAKTAIAAFDTKLTEYTDSIEAAYAPAKLGEEITFESQKAALLGDIDEMSQNYDSDVADYNALLALQAQKENLAFVYNQVTDSIQSLYGIEKTVTTKGEDGKEVTDTVYSYKKAYDNVKSGWINEVAVLFTTCNDDTKSIDGKNANPAGMAGEEGDAIAAAIAATKQKIEAKLTAYSAIVDNQNTYMTTVMDKVESVEKSRDEITSQFEDGIPAALKEAKYEEFLADLNAALEAYQSTAVAGYTAVEHNVSDDYKATEEGKTLEELAADLDAKLTAFVDTVDGAMPIYNLQVALNKAVDGLPGEVKDKDGNVLINIRDKFATTVANIQATIDALTSNPSKADREVIENAIAQLTSDAKALHTIFTTTYEEVNEYIESVDSFAEFIKAKLIVEGSEFDVEKYTKETYTPLKEAADKYLTDLKAAAANENPQNCYSAAVKVNNSFDAEELQLALINTVTAFAKAATDANDDAVSKKFAEVKKHYTDSLAANAYGYATFTGAFDDMQKKLDDIEAAIAAIAGQTGVAAGDDVEPSTPMVADAPNAYGLEDVKLDELLTTIKGADADMATLDKSNANYAALLLDIASTQAKIDQATADNEKSVGNGKKFFAAEIAELQKKLDDAEKAIKEEHDAAGLDKGKMNYGITDEEAAAYKKTLEGISNDAGTVSTNIAANNSAFSQLQITSANTRTALQTLIDDLEAHQYAPTEVQAAVDSIQALIDTDLLAADTKVSEAYGKGEAGTDRATLEQEYTDILNKAIAISDNYEENSAAYAAKANADLVDAQGWKTDLTKLNAAYYKAIENYNFFLYRIHNKGYEAALDDGKIFENFTDLYDYSNNINELIEYEGVFLSSWNQQKAVIPVETWNSEIGDPAKELLKTIQDRCDALTAATNAIAEAYYASLHAQCVEQISDDNATLEGLGVDDAFILEGLMPAVDKLNNVTSVYEATKADEKAVIGREMDKIATDLDDVHDMSNNTVLNEIAQKGWDDLYTAATDKVAELEDQVKALKALGGYLESEFTDALDALAEVNAEAKAEKDLVSNYKTLEGQLDAIIAGVQSYVDECVAEDAANTAVNDQLAAYATEMERLQKALDDFTAYANGFTVAAQFTAYEASAQETLDEIKGISTNFKGTLEKWVAKVDGMIGAFNQDLEDLYTALGASETEVLNDWCEKVRKAYDNAFEGNGEETKVEDMAEYNTRINAANDAVVALGAKLPLTTNDAEFAASADELITELTAIYSELKAQWPDYVPGETTAEVLAGLDDLYNQVDGSISLAQDELAGFVEDVQAEYAPKFEEFKAELDAIKAAYTAEGNKVLANYGAYNDQLTALETAVAAAEAAMKAANDDAVAEQERFAASDARAAVLETELSALKDRRDAIVALAESYGQLSYIYDEENGTGIIASFDSKYTRAESLLAQLKENHALTADTTLPYRAILVNNLNTAEETVAENHFWLQYNDAMEVVGTDIYKAFDASHIVGRDALNLEWAALMNRLYQESAKLYTTPEDETFEEKIARYNECADECVVIKADAEALLEKIQQNTYTPGNVDMSEDGEINALDVQTLVYWIGESTGTGEELYTQVEEEYGPVVAAAADIVGAPNVKSIDIADVTADIDLSLGKDVSGIKSDLVAARMAAKTAETITMEYVGEFDGAKRYALVLNNGATIIGSQLDITLPSSSSLVAVNSTERTADHQVVVFERNGSARVMIFSMENVAFAGNTGAIAYIDVQGAAPVFAEATLSAQGNRSIAVKPEGTTGIMDAIMEGAAKTKEAIYDAVGRLYNKAQRGLNIIRHSDGSVTKEIRK